MTRSRAFLGLLAIFVGLGVIGFLTLEGTPPAAWKGIFGPFLLFVYGNQQDIYLAVASAVILFPLIAMPTFMRSRAAYIGSLIGLFLWVGAAKIIVGIAI